MKKAAFLFFRVEVGNAACAVQYLVVVQTMLVRCPKNLDFTVFQKVSLSNLIFHGIGLAIKRAREASGMTQEQLGYIVDRDPRTIMYHENDGQHPSLNAFYQMVTMFGISVDEYHKAADALVELLDSAWLNDLRQKNEQEFNYWKPRHFAVELEDIGGLWEIIAQSVEIDSKT